MAKRGEYYTSNMVRPPDSSASVVAFTAFTMAKRYRYIPSVAELRDHYGMSRACAYRWRAAMRAAGWTDQPE